MPIGAILPVIGGLVGAAGAVASAVIGSKAAKKASNAQVKATDQASATTLKMYNQSRADLAPYANSGLPGLDKYNAMLGLPSKANPTGGPAWGASELAAFRNNPAYKAELELGMDAMNKSKAAQGLLLSGGAMKDALSFGRQLADTHFGDYMDRLNQIAAKGQSAAAGQGAAAMTTGSNLSNLALARGEAQASGAIGSGNALSAGIAGLGSNLGYLAMRNPSAYQTA